MNRKCHTDVNLSHHHLNMKVDVIPCVSWSCFKFKCCMFPKLADLMSKPHTAGVQYYYGTRDTGSRHRAHTDTENWKLSWCQLCHHWWHHRLSLWLCHHWWHHRLSLWLCHHWWHHRLSLWQPMVPPVKTKLASWQLSVFNKDKVCEYEFQDVKSSSLPMNKMYGCILYILTVFCHVQWYDRYSPYNAATFF